MVFTLGLSSDIVSGLAAVVIATALYTLTSLAYPRLMSKSTEKRLATGDAIRVSTRSMNSASNCLGFWALFLTVLAHLIALTLEFGFLGVTVPVYSEQPALVLGGGRRFSSGNSSELFSSERAIPYVFGAAVRSCISFEVNADYKMIKNGLPAIGTGNNRSSTSMDRFDVFECTSSWLGSAEWTIDPAGNLTIDMDTVVEQYGYEDVSWGNSFGGGVSATNSDNLTIYYALGQSYRGEVSRVVLFDNLGFIGLGAETAAISVSVEEDHYVYSVSTELTNSTTGGKTYVQGPFRRGHFRFTEFSLGAIVSMLLVSGACDTMSECYSSSESFWETESTSADFNSLVYGNPAGSEESWPTLPGLNGEVFSEYEKPVSPEDYPFKSSEREITVISSWCIAVCSIFGVVVLALCIGSYFIGSSNGFSTYDGLSKMAAGTRSGFPVASVVSNGGREYVGFVSQPEEMET